MTQQEMFEKCFERPRNFLNLSEQEQWEIDKNLGILDWDDSDLEREEIERYREYFDPPMAPTEDPT